MTGTRTRVAWLALLTAAVLCSAAGPVQAQTTLRYQFKEGDKLDYDLEQKIITKMELGGKERTITMTHVIDLSWQVTAVDAEGQATVKQRFNRYRFTVEGSLIGKIEYDTKDGVIPADEIGVIMGPFFKAVSGAEFTLTMTRRGEVTKVSMSQKLLDAFKNMKAAAGLGDMPSKDELERLVRETSMVLPKGPVSKGDTWRQELETKLPFGKLEVKRNYTYQGAIEGQTGLEEIAIKPVITFTPDPDAKIAMKLKNTDAKGAAQFDNAAGRLTEMRITQDMQQEISFAGRDIPSSIQQAILLKLRNKAK